MELPGLILKAVNAGNESGGVPIAKRLLSSLFSVLVRDACALRKKPSFLRATHPAINLVKQSVIEH